MHTQHNAIILHGMPGRDEYYSDTFPSASNSHWIPWLQKQLLVRDIPAYTPEMPHAYAPRYAVWQREFERYDVTPETILVGHSCGGGFLVRWLSEHKRVRVHTVVLVAPWLDPDTTLTTGFFDFELDPDVPLRVRRLVIFHSDTDGNAIRKSVGVLRQRWPQHTYREFHNYGHFTFHDLKTQAFPELLDTVTVPRVGNGCVS